MNSWTPFFLGIIALGSLVQVGLLVTAGVVAWRSARAFGRIRDEMRRETAQPMANVSETVRNVRRIASLVGEEVHTLQSSIHRASDEVTTAKVEVKRAWRGPVARIAALRKAVVRGVSVYRETGPTPVAR
jgi:hypothetical protein